MTNREKLFVDNRLSLSLQQTSDTVHTTQKLSSLHAGKVGSQQLSLTALSHSGT